MTARTRAAAMADLWTHVGRLAGVSAVAAAMRGNVIGFMGIVYRVGILWCS